MIARVILPIALACLFPVGQIRTAAEVTDGAPEEEDGDTFLGIDAMVRDAPERGEGELAYDEGEFYLLPDADSLPFDAEAISLSAAQSGLLLRALCGVACDYPSGRAQEQVPMGVKQMALALARRLDGHDPVARIAEYELRRGRAPRALPGKEDRDALAAKLWNAGFGLHRYAKSEDDRALAACILDLAARFDPSDAARRRAMADLGLPDAGTRWEGVTEIPELEASVAEHSAPPTAPAVPETVETPVNERFAFASGEASVAVFAGNGGEGYPRLRVRLVTDRSELSDPVKRSGKPLGLEADIPGAAFSPVAASAMESALAGIDRRLPGWRETGCFLHYTLGTPVSAESERCLAPAAVVLAELLAGGRTPDPAMAIAGSLAPDGGPGNAVGLADDLADAADDAVRLVAVPAAAESAFGDLALLGNLEALLARQYLSYATLDELAAIVPKDRPLAFATALESFGEIQELAARMPPVEMIANHRVRERLRDIVAGAPNHLSARYLLAAALDRLPAGLSLSGSVSQLRGIERPLRDLIRQRLHPSAEAPAPTLAQAGVVFSESEFALRRLRPILHPEARPFADGLVVLVDDLRVQIRADAARSAVLLQSALDHLEFQVARFAGEE